MINTKQQDTQTDKIDQTTSHTKNSDLQLNEESIIKASKSISNKIPEKNQIKQYEKKIASMSQMIIKLNNKIQQQRNQFKVLNEKLNNAINKLTSGKNRQKSPNQQNNQLQLSRKQLQNQLKRSKLLKKQNQTLKQTLSLLNNAQKIVEMQNEIKDKTRQINQLKTKLKGYERADINQKTNTHYKKQEQMIKRLNQLNQENIFLKKKIIQTKDKTQQLNKNKTQSSQKVQNTINKIQNQIQKSIPQKKKQKSSSTINEIDKAFIKRQIYQQQMMKLSSQVKSYQSININQQKQYKVEIQSLKVKIRILNEQVDELKQQIKRKNKQSFILEHRNLQHMRRSQFSQRKYLSIQHDQKDDKNKTININQPKNIHQIQFKNMNINQFKDINRKQPKNIQLKQAFGSIRKQFLGLIYVNSDNFKRHDDSLKLDQAKNYKISQVQFTYFEQHILSLKVKYKYLNGEQLSIVTFMIQHSYTNIKTTKLDLQEYQYIKSIQIYCSKMIQFIQIKTSRNKLLQVGNQKNQIKCRKFQFEIKSHEKPVAFACITQVKKINDTKKQCLVTLGLILKKKDISISKSPRLKVPSIQKQRYMNKSIDSKLIKNPQQLNL